MTYIEELRDVIKRLHGVESVHLESVPIKESFQGKTVWEGNRGSIRAKEPSKGPKNLRMGL